MVSVYILIMEAPLSDSLRVLTKTLNYENYTETNNIIKDKDWRWIQYDVVEIENQVTIISENRIKQPIFPNDFYDFSDEQLSKMSADLKKPIVLYNCFDNEHYVFAKFDNGAVIIQAYFIAGGPPTIIPHNLNSIPRKDFFRELKIPFIENPDTIFNYLKSLPITNIIFQCQGEKNK